LSGREPKTQEREMSSEEIKKIAEEMVALYRSEFPGEGPDWKSDWWSGFRNWEDGEFSAFLAACKATWAATRDGQDAEA
jgi:hypothetical protein